MPATDRELLAEYAASGSDSAFAELVDRHSTAVYVACLRLAGEVHAAEDAVQAVFLLLARKAGSLRRERGLGGWLLTVARNVALTARREEARRRQRELALRSERLREAGKEAAEMAVKDSPESSWREVRPYLDGALAALPKAQRSAVVLRFIEGRSREDAARELGCSAASLSVTVSRGLERLRGLLARRGVAVPAAALGAMLAAEAGAGAAAVPPALLAVLKGIGAGLPAAGLGAKAGTEAGAVPAKVDALAEGAMKAMTMAKLKFAAAAMGCVLVAGGGGGALAVRLAAIAGETAPAGSPVTILNGDSGLRSYLVFRTPVVCTKAGEIKTAPDPAAKGQPMPDYQSAPPPEGWTRPEFDDSDWASDRAPVEMEHGRTAHTATENSIICLRARFRVDDPARAGDLKLSIEYVGGVAVFVNGQEAARASLPAGELKLDTLAEKYPDDLYCEPGGMFLQPDRNGKIGNPAGLERRYRKLADLAIPARLLRKGSNVLALQIHRAPINDGAMGAKRVAVGAMSVTPGIWAYAGLRALNLTGSGAVPNVARPGGIQVWNCAPFDNISCFDYGSGGELVPVSIAATRNGVFSGRLVVSSDQEIKGLKASVSDLVSADGGKIPAAAVLVRCAEIAQPAKSWVPGHLFDGLAEAIPAEIPVAKVSTPKAGPWRGQTAGAVAPLWFTVRVPRDAKAGNYEGTIVLSADGLKPVTVPLQVTVSAWTMPDPKDLRLMHFAYHSTDAMARHYGVPVWSEKHLDLVGKSMALAAEVNSRQAIVNLAINFYGGNKGGVDSSNEDTLVRWIKGPDGSFKHDFTLFDKYLDMIAKAIGKPVLLRVNCWGEVGRKDGKLAHSGSVTKVSALDPATGKVEPMDQPVPGTEESFQFWKPVLDEVRKKVEARGWWDVTALGHNSYNHPPIPEVISVARRIWPDGVWSYTAHNGTMGARWAAIDKGVSMPVRQADCVWTLGPIANRGYRKLFDPRPTIWCFTWRGEMRDYSEPAMFRSVPEDEIMRGHDGVSDFGADLFPLKSDRGRHFAMGNGRGTGGPGNSTLALLAPGPDGPVGTARFEMLREGTELCEAILFLEKALQDKKIDGDLAGRVNRALDERGDAMIRSSHRFQAKRMLAVLAPGRLARDRRLLELAGEAATAAKP